MPTQNSKCVAMLPGVHEKATLVPDKRRGCIWRGRGERSCYWRARGHVSVVGRLPRSVDQRVETHINRLPVAGQVAYGLDCSRHVAGVIQVARAYAGCAYEELKVRGRLPGVHEKATLVPASGVEVFGAGVVSTACVGAPLAT